MPRISQFFGIVIAMYHSDHAPPHFHVKYAEFMAVVEIDTLDIREGQIPRRALNMVLEWAALHRAALRLDWEKAQAGLPLDWIEPLD
ncbi:MAG: DUF4160 domain-containing protein [Chloroflexi bacterium]|nr:DUF4160 domain-containing protein [Chloroflexota bacterium]